MKFMVKFVERGAALIELSLVAVVMLVLLAAVVDLGRAANAYFQLRNMAYSAARIASQENALSNESGLKGFYDITTSGAAPIAQEPSGSSDPHALLHSEIIELLRRAAIEGLDPSYIKIETSLEDQAFTGQEGQVNGARVTGIVPGISGYAACSGDVVYAGINADYQSIFGFKFGLSAKRWLPFLYQRGNVMPEQCYFKAQPPQPIPNPAPSDPFVGNHS